MTPVRCAGLGLLVAASACTFGSRVADQITVAPEDHHAYRSYRAAETVEGKLQAAWRYVKTQPAGHYRNEVRTWFIGADRDYRRLAANRPELLHGYLRLMPDSPSAPLVRERLTELALAKTFQVRREQELTVQAREFELQLAEAKRERDAFLHGVVLWIARLAALGPWGGPVGELNQEFLVVYTLQQPAVRCDELACVKQLSYRYVVPERGTLSPRSAEIDVRLGLEQGRVVLAELSGHALFDRLAEANQLTPVPAGDALARAEAIGRAVQLTGQALDARFPAARCGREAVSPVVIERECDGLRVRVVAAERPDLPDRIEFVPSAAPAPPAEP